MTKPKTEPIEAEVINETPEAEKPKRSRSRGEVAKAEVSVVAGLELNTKDLKKALDAQTEQRKLIADFVKKHLIKGTDYIRIHVVRNCQAEDQRKGSCKTTSHFSKDILAKPGQEKIFSLFQLTNELVRDNETIEMLEGTRNLVAYKCIVKTNSGKVVAEGRGAAIVGDNRRDVNATIKIAEKRARMDACLSLGFSEYFAQDLDDPDYQTQKKAAEEQAAAKADDGTGLDPRPANKPIDEQERTMLARHLIKLGFDSRDEQLELLRLNGVSEPRKITSGQARELILKLKNNAFAAPAKTGTVLDDLDELDEEAVESELTAAAEKRKTAAKVAELEKDPQLVIDEDLMNMVRTRAEALPLTGMGKMWLYKKVCGRPYSSWDKMKDEEWRRAYELIEQIDLGNFQIPDEYITGVVVDDAKVKKEEESSNGEPEQLDLE